MVAAVAVARSLAAVLAVSVANAQAVRGRVVDDAGEPIAGAIVFATANKVRCGDGVGTCSFGFQVPDGSWHCPLCLADRGRRARAGVDGSFVVAGCDPDFGHYVVASAPGYRSDWTGPGFAGGAPVVVELARLPTPAADEAAPWRSLDVVVTDAEREPVANATVVVVGIVRAAKPPLWRRRDVDRFAVTDARGRARLTVGPLVADPDASAPPPAPIRTVVVRVRPARPGVDDAAAVVMPLAVGHDGPHSIELPRGQIVRGHTAPGAVVRLTPIVRHPSGFVGPLETTADSEGGFAFAGVGVGRWTLSGRVGRDRVVSGITVAATADGTPELDVGRLGVVDGRRVTGRVVVPAGASLPRDHALTLNRLDAFVVERVPLDDDGRFVVSGVAPGARLALYPHVDGLRIAATDPHRDPSAPDRVAGRVTTDLDSLVVTLERGKTAFPARPVTSRSWRPFEPPPR